MTLKIPKNLPSSLLGNHQLLQVRSVLVPNPKERCGDVELRPGMSRHGTLAQSEVEILDEE